MCRPPSLAGAHTAPLGDKNLGHSSLDGSGQTRCAPRFVRLTLLVLTGEENAMSSAEDDSLLPATRYGSVMSTPNINQLVDHRVDSAQHAKFNRSSSVGPGMTASTLNPQQRDRRALYVNLPFFRCAKRGGSNMLVTMIRTSYDTSSDTSYFLYP